MKPLSLWLYASIVLANTIFAAEASSFNSDIPVDPTVHSSEGLSVIARIYPKPETAPSEYDRISLPIRNGNQIEFGSHDFPANSIVVISGKDQDIALLKQTLDRRIIIAEYKDDGSVLISPGERQAEQTWVCKDALGKPIPNARVQVYLHHQRMKNPGVLVDELTADDLGRVAAVQGQGDQWVGVSLIVSQANYGMAKYWNLAIYEQNSQIDVILPLVLAGSDEDQTSVQGIVVNEEDKPLAEIAISCSEIRTLDEGLIMPKEDGRFAVLTDKDGQFRMYVPPAEQQQEERGEYIPPKSKYRLHIEMPPEAEYRTYDGWVYNDRNAVIKLARKDITELTTKPQIQDGGSYRAFSFKDENGETFKREELEKIVLFIRRENKPAIQLGYSELENGGIYPNGLYDASIRRYRPWVPEMEYKFKPLEVGQGSPAVLVFELSDPVIYHGQVIDGVSKMPLEGAFLIAIYSSAQDHNLAQVTPEQWKLLHALGPNPDMADPALKPIRDVYTFQTVLRTEAEGRFSFAALPEDKVWGCVVFDENYLPVKLDIVNYLRNQSVQSLDFGEIPLFPAGKIQVETIVDEKNVSVMPEWLIDPEKSPAWAANIKDADKNWLNINTEDVFYVPAQVTLTLTFQMPYDEDWEPLTPERDFFLSPGETVDLGKQTLQRAIWIAVKVIDPNEQPVEGVPIRRPQTTAHITGVDGTVKFHVPKNSCGTVGIMYHSSDENRRLEKTVQYSVKGEQDAGREYIIRLSEEDLNILFDQ